jgi:hypothetical protein
MKRSSVIQQRSINLASRSRRHASDHAFDRLIIERDCYGAITTAPTYWQRRNAVILRHAARFGVCQTSDLEVRVSGRAGFRYPDRLNRIADDCDRLECVLKMRWPVQNGAIFQYGPVNLTAWSRCQFADFTTYVFTSLGLYLLGEAAADCQT